MIGAAYPHYRVVRIGGSPVGVCGNDESESQDVSARGENRVYVDDEILRHAFRAKTLKDEADKRPEAIEVDVHPGNAPA